MAIQSSINSLLSQAQMLATFYKGFDKADKIIGDQEIAKNEARIQTDISAGNVPMKDGKVDPEWLQKRREEHEKERASVLNKKAFDNDDGGLTEYGKSWARITDYKVKRGDRLDSNNSNFYNNPIVQEYLKSRSANSELKNEVARKLARASVEARTDSIKQAKSNFDEHTASLIKYYSKGSGNP